MKPIKLQLKGSSSIASQLKRRCIFIHHIISLTSCSLMVGLWRWMRVLLSDDGSSDINTFLYDIHPLPGRCQLLKPIANLMRQSTKSYPDQRINNNQVLIPNTLGRATWSHIRIQLQNVNMYSFLPLILVKSYMFIQVHKAYIFYNNIHLCLKRTLHSLLILHYVHHLCFLYYCIQKSLLNMTKPP